ncbi:MAG: hypothetical protein IAI50_10775 [Candidatus Eremiobacteraeota bacterium]|nr:hypothetical protein [Candidatus Eremiobacteraeota bacterium]
MKSSATLGAGDADLECELGYHRAQVAWIARQLDTAARELDRVHGSLTGDLLLEAIVMRGAIEAARGNVAGQGALLLDSVRLLRASSDPGALPWAVIGSQIAYLARELPGTALREASYIEVARIPWTPDLAVLHFTMVRAIAWRHALDGDYFNAFRRLKEAGALAPSSGWSVTASCDRAYFASVLGERRWSEQELSDAQELAASVDWRSLDGEECFSLLVLAELFAPRDASLALSYVAQYKDAATRFNATLASRDDRRVDAQEAYAFGVVQHALGDRAEATRLLREAFAIYDAIGYDWRAGRAALALADVTRDGAWRERARDKLAAYPLSWLRVTDNASSPPSPPPIALLEVANLTHAQRAVYELLLRGLSTTEIAAEQKRSEFTVRNHIKAIFKAFGVNSRPALLARASGHDRQ